MRYLRMFTCSSPRTLRIIWKKGLAEHLNQQRERLSLRADQRQDENSQPERGDKLMFDARGRGYHCCPVILWWLPVSRPCSFLSHTEWHFYQIWFLFLRLISALTCEQDFLQFWWFELLLHISPSQILYLSLRAYMIPYRRKAQRDNKKTCIPSSLKLLGHDMSPNMHENLIHVNSQNTKKNFPVPSTVFCKHIQTVHTAASFLTIICYFLTHVVLVGSHANLGGYWV